MNSYTYKSLKIYTFLYFYMITGFSFLQKKRRKKKQENKNIYDIYPVTTDII